MELMEMKDKIQIVSASPETNVKCKTWLMEADDCFGRGYDEENKYCKECNVAAEIDGRREPLFIFCREIIFGATPEEFEEQAKEFAGREVEPEEPAEKSKPKVKVKEKPMKGGGIMEKVTGTTALIRNMLKEGKSEDEIVTALIPTFTEKGITEAVAKRKIKPYIQRELNKKPKVEAPCCETM